MCYCLCFHFPEVERPEWIITLQSQVVLLECVEGAFEFKGQYFKLFLLPLSFHEMLHYHHMCVALVLVPAVDGVQ